MSSVSVINFTMRGNAKLREIIKDIEVIGISSSSNDELFASQELDVRDISEFVMLPGDEIKEGSEFCAKEVIVFDSVARLDSTIMTKRGLIGFITMALGSMKFTDGQEIIFSESLKSEIRRIIISPREVISGDLGYIEISDNIVYEIVPQVRDYIYTYEELWKEIFLKEYLPKIENEFIRKFVIREMDEDTILIKDGRLEISRKALPYDIEDGNLWFNIFGNVKNYQINVNRVALNFVSCRGVRTFIECEDYSEMNAMRYQSYVNLGRLEDRDSRHEVFKKGIFNFSRVDMIIPKHLENISKLVDRYNFISNYLRKMTFIFSTNPRFPQNLPIVSVLESYLRNLMGKREILIKDFMNSY